MRLFLIPLGTAVSPFDKGDKEFCANTEVRRPPWRARQVRPPVVRPVRKIRARLVDSMNCYILADFVVLIQINSLCYNT